MSPPNKDSVSTSDFVLPPPPKSSNLSKICIIIDTSLLSEEIYMVSDSIIFCHPLSLSLDDCRTIVGNMYTMHGILTSLRKTSVPTLIDTVDCKMGVFKICSYFVVLSGPNDMSNETIIQQVKLFIDSLIFFLGPLGSLYIQYNPDQIKTLIRKVARHIINTIIPDRGVTFRNNVGYLPSKSNVPPDCILRCLTMLNRTEVYGGAVIHDKKVVYTNLDSCILSILFAMDESNVPIDKIPCLENATIIRIFLTGKMWVSLKSTSNVSEGRVESHSKDTIESLLQNLDVSCNQTGTEERGNLTPSNSSFELVSLDLPEDKFASTMSSRKFPRSFSTQNTKFSLLNELFDSNKGKGIRGAGPLKRSKTIASINYDSFHDSLESQASGSELPGNSLNYKLLTRDDEILPSPPQNTDQAPDSPLAIQHTRDKPSDSTSNDSVYHETLEYFIPYVTDSELRVCELLVLTRVNTTVILLGENLSDKIQQYWRACLLLLGEVSGCFDVEAKPKPQKTTKGVNSFVFNKQTKTLLFSNAGKTSSGSHQQIKFCKAWCDDESDVELICVKGLNCSTTVKNTASSNVYLTSHSMRCSKLADNIADITGRNFDSVFL